MFAIKNIREKHGDFDLSENQELQDEGKAIFLSYQKYVKCRWLFQTIILLICLICGSVMTVDTKFTDIRLVVNCSKLLKTFIHTWVHNFALPKLG